MTKTLRTIRGSIPRLSSKGDKMLQTWLTILLLQVCVSLAAADDKGRVQRDIAYSEADKQSTSLDVYAPGGGADRPVMIWIHGGGWQVGDKANVQVKPRAFNDQGFVFASINYRLFPDATYKDQAADVAKAIRWVRDHAGEFRGSPDRLFLMGHSAGAHLAALVATDQRYLEAEGMKLGDVQGVILLDGACYDVAKQIEMGQSRGGAKMFLTVFSDDPAKQQDASPIAHASKGKGIPAFLILYVADRQDSRLQSEALAQQLESAGTSASVVAAEGKTHATINRELGEAGDAPTEAVFEFLERQLSHETPGS